VRADEISGDEAAHVGRELAGIAIARARIAGERLREDRAQVRRMRDGSAAPVGWACGAARSTISVARALGRASDGEHVEQGRAEREHVGARVDALAARLLGAMKPGVPATVPARVS